MVKKLKISYIASNENKGSAGKFNFEVYDEIENSLVDIIEVISLRIGLKKLKNINITIEEVKKEKK
jgi:hypothetical protein